MSDAYNAAGRPRRRTPSEAASDARMVAGLRADRHAEAGAWWFAMLGFALAPVGALEWAAGLAFAEGTFDGCESCGDNAADDVGLAIVEGPRGYR